MCNILRFNFDFCNYRSETALSLQSLLDAIRNSAIAANTVSTKHLSTFPSDTTLLSPMHAASINKLNGDAPVITSSKVDHKDIVKGLVEFILPRYPDVVRFAFQTIYIIYHAHCLSLLTSLLLPYWVNEAKLHVGILQDIPMYMCVVQFQWLKYIYIYFVHTYIYCPHVRTYIRIVCVPYILRRNQFSCPF